MRKLIWLILAVLVFAACGNLYQRFYENTRSVRDSRRSPAERAIAPSPSYDQYKREREGKSQQ